MFLILLRKLHGIYVAAVFVVVVLLLFCPLLIAAPTLVLRRQIGRAAVRCWLALSGIPFRVRGLENLPDHPAVVICNHASYLDGILLTAALPAGYTFLVQSRAAKWFYIGLVLRRMGVAFVNRWSAREAARATREVIDRLRAGESFVIFPEGTFRAPPVLLPFQPGAFVISARAGVPVVPCVLRGSRALLGDGRLLFRWSPIEIECFAPMQASADSRAAADALSLAARAVILAHAGEADGLAQAPSAALGEASGGGPADGSGGGHREGRFGGARDGGRDESGQGLDGRHAEGSNHPHSAAGNERDAQAPVRS